MSIDSFRNKNGFIVIDNLKYADDEKKSHFWINYNLKKYYYKKCNTDYNNYNELFAEELSKDFGIKCAHYDLAIYKNEPGVISEDFIGDNKFISMSELFLKYYGQDKDKENNLTYIWNILSLEYKDEKLVGKLMDQFVDIFLFDVLIANVDRHSSNYGILKSKDNNITIAPLFDNQSMLSDLTLLEGGYALGVDEDDTFFTDDYYDPSGKFLFNFLTISSQEYRKKLEDKLWIISSDNIDNVISRVEERIKSKIPSKIIKYIKSNFELNLINIRYILEETKKRKLV